MTSFEKNRDDIFIYKDDKRFCIHFRMHKKNKTVDFHDLFSIFFIFSQICVEQCLLKFLKEIDLY